MSSDNINSALGLEASQKAAQSGNAPLKAPSTDVPDGSALALKAAGQIPITIGWIVFVLCAALGIADFANGRGLFGIPLSIIGIFALVTGYIRGASRKATAKAAIEATKAAERTARMEQMMVNMVNGSGQVAQPQVQAKCPKCGAAISGSIKFCPECGASTKAKCAKCGAEMASDAKFCPECDTKADKE